MDLAQLFKPVEKIVGVEITQGYILAVLLERDKKSMLRMNKKSAALAAGVITGGVVQDKPRLTAALKDFVEKNKDMFRSKYVIVSLPSAFVFTDTMRFPPLGAEQIGESIALNIRSKSLFPIDPEDVYYDWQPAASHSPLYQDALVSFALKKNIDEYCAVCEAAGIQPLAFEIPQISIARALANFKDTTGLVVRLLDEGVELSIIARGEFRFSRFVPMPATLHNLAEFKAFVKDEAFKAINFFAVEYPETAVGGIVVISYFAQKEEVSAHLAQELRIPVQAVRLTHPMELTDASIAAFGSAMRGLIPREEDTLVSLMPVGTEEAYRARRFRAYVSLWSDIINTTAAVLVFVFGATLFFLTKTHDNLRAQIAGTGTAAAVHAQITQLEETARHFNGIVAQIAATQENAARWSLVFERVAPTLTHDGITIESISARHEDNAIVVQFAAVSRDAAISFKKSLETSGAYATVDMPFLSVAQWTNIRTGVSLTLATTP